MNSGWLTNDQPNRNCYYDNNGRIMTIMFIIRTLLINITITAINNDDDDDKNQTNKAPIIKTN